MSTLMGLARRRPWAERSLIVVAVTALVAVLIAAVPVWAGSGDPTGPLTTDKGVRATERDLGGQPNDCPAVGSSATYEYRIESPQDGQFTDNQAGFPVVFTLDKYKTGGNEFFDWDITGASVRDVVVKGGSNSAHFDYVDPAHDSTWAGGAVTSDDGNHATEKSGNKLYAVSHVSFCYSVVGTISGNKWHDNDTDGTQDPSFEIGLTGWTIYLYDGATLVATTTTGAGGNYSFDDVPLGADYTVCEGIETPSAGAGDGVFSWAQSDLSSSTWSTTACPAGVEPGGHNVTLDGDASGLNFGNHLQVSVDCSADREEPYTVILGGDGDPLATITIPANCPSDVFTSPFDVGRSNDADDWSQFVVFGGDPNATSIVIDETISWVAEDGNYVGGILQVPTTLVLLPAGGGSPVPVVWCGPGDPTLGDVEHCLVNRTIAEGPAVEPWVTTPTQIELTEHYQFLGDPPKFR